jgi:hypothetical protein
VAKTQRAAPVPVEQSILIFRGHKVLLDAEHGAIMAATVLNSPRAVEMSVYVVRAFVKLRGALASNKELTQKLDQLERKLQTHDQAIVARKLASFQWMHAPTFPADARAGPQHAGRAAMVEGCGSKPHNIRTPASPRVSMQNHQ